MTNAKKSKPAPWVEAFPPVEKTNPRRQYIKAKRRFLAGKRCAVWPWKKAVDVHHVRGRAGNLLTDERFWLAVSRQAHERIHAHPAWARVRGWLAEKGDWNRAPDDYKSASGL